MGNKIQFGNTLQSYKKTIGGWGADMGISMEGVSKWCLTIYSLCDNAILPSEKTSEGGILWPCALPQPNPVTFTLEADVIERVSDSAPATT